MTTKSKAPMSGALAQTIARHTAAEAAMVEAASQEDCPEHLLEGEIEALDELAFTTCVSDAEFIEKLRYLHACEIRISGAPTGLHEFSSVVLAVDCHFCPVNG